MLDRIKKEPALVLGLVQTALGLVLAFGLDLSNEQVGAIMAVTAAILALVTRSQVTPTSTAGDDNERGQVDTLLLIAVLALVLAVLAIFGVRLG